MKRLPAVLCLLAAVSYTGLAQFRAGYGALTESETAASMRDQVSYLSSVALEGRAPGSEGEKQAAGYISEVLGSYGVDVLSGREGDVFGMLTDNGDTLTSRNVVAYIPGYDKELGNRFILVGARLSGPGMRVTSVDGNESGVVLPGANGNASGLSILLQLAKRLQTNRVLLRRSVVIAAFGASEPENAGSWYFLNRSYKSMAGDIDAMINLDMLGTASNGFYAYTASNPDLNALVGSLRGTLQPMHPEIVTKEPVRSDHRQFYAAGIPSVFFTTGMYPEYNTASDDASVLQYEDMERELEYIYNFTVALACGKKPLFDSAQKESARKPQTVLPYYNCDVKPSFLGSQDPGFFLKKWVYVYQKYPREAVERGIQGRVLVGFEIDEKGKVGNVTVERGVDPLLDEEAVRVISASPDWKPARVDGKPVKCSMSLYVEFRLKRNR